MTRIVAIGGVTAAGKTGAAIALARRLGGELVGADSVQVYRGFDIGSAKPTAAELGEVRHHLLDVLDPEEEIDAARYARMADAAIADIAARGRVPIVVGGTGLWMRALLRGLVELPEVDPAVRARIEAEADAVGAPASHERLRGVDPAAAARIHPNDRLRIVRRSFTSVVPSTYPSGSCRRSTRGARRATTPGWWPSIARAPTSTMPSGRGCGPCWRRG